MQENTELLSLVAALQSGAERPSPATEMPLHYQRAFGSESGKLVLADLVANFPVVAPRHLPGGSLEDCMQRDGAAQVIGHILTRMVSRPKKAEEKKPAKKRAARETSDDIN